MATDHDTSYCSVGGGKLHTVGPQSAHATIAGGDGNSATGEAPAIGGGTLNTIESGTTYGVIAGGGGNRVAAGTFSSTIAGGYLNQVAGDFSFAAGNRAQAVKFTNLVASGVSRIIPNRWQIKSRSSCTPLTLTLALALTLLGASTLHAQNFAIDWFTIDGGGSTNGTNKFILVQPPVGNRFYRLIKP